MTLSLAFNSPAATDQVWSVAQLSASVKRLIENHGVQLWVRGEVVQSLEADREVALAG